MKKQIILAVLASFLLSGCYYYNPSFAPRHAYYGPHYYERIDFRPAVPVYYHNYPCSSYYGYCR